MARATTQRTTTRSDAELAQLRDQVGEIGNQLGDLLTKAKRDGTAIAEAELTELQARVQAIMADLKVQGREALDRVEETVKEHPGGSLLAAFAAGALLAVLLRK